MQPSLATRFRSDEASPFADDVAFLTTQIVNLAFVGCPGAGDREWVLVDTGMPGSAGRIVRAAAKRFGPRSRPAAIVLTHGHFDHVGAVCELAALWSAPVYAHELELPYLTGKSAYPPADPTVGGGAMARLSPLFPRQPIDLGSAVRPLPGDGSGPALPGWRWLHTPGHAPGHVSFYRDADGTLLAGDAFVTVQQESALAVLTQRVGIHGPPRYYTIDWDLARGSVRRLADLRPERALTGHGQPVAGDALRDGLEALAVDFDRVARPPRGRYATEPARTDLGGVTSIPPAPADPAPKVAAGLIAAALAGGTYLAVRRRGHRADE